MQEEIWKETEVSGYFISNYGRLKGRSGKIIKSYLNKRMGYYMICIHLNGRASKSKCLKIHRLVAKAFVSNLNNYSVVNHIDGNKQNNYFKNLEWCTFSENTKHAFRIGLSKAKQGPDHKCAKLTRVDVAYIKKNYISGDRNFGARALARKFNITRDVISSVLKGKSYKNC